MTPARIVMVVNVEWYFLSHRLPVALALQARGHEVVVATAIERGRADEIRGHGLRFVELPMVRGQLAPRRDTATLRALLRLYRDERPDLIYHTTIKPILYGSLAARMSGIRTVINVIPGLGHVFSQTGGAARVRRWLVERGYSAAFAGAQTRAVFQNDHDRRLFVDRGIVGEPQTAVIKGSGVNLSQFAAAPPSDEDPPIVLMASRLLWDKGVGELVDAARELKRRELPCRVVIVGIPDDNPNAVPAATLRAWEQDGLIEWWGLRDDMPRVLSRASVVALPSYYPEGVPRILLEAAAVARPVVTTDTPGCCDAVRPGITGLLVPPRQPGPLTEALAALLTDPGRRREMGARARMLAEAEFGEDRIASQTADLCETLLREAFR
jgi:glycosyltransferase involved in cell wall biosynthesis